MATPPRAPKRPTTLTLHGDERIDEWYWLRDRDDPAVLAHLEAENAYVEEVLAPTKALQEALFEEIRSRIQETDLSVPVTKGGWRYYARTVEGLQYPIHCRRPAGSGTGEVPAGGEPPPDEVVLVDENQLAGETDYFDLGVLEISPDGWLMAYATDHDGDEVYVLRVRDLRSGADTGDVIDDVAANAVWAADGETLFYVRQDATMRPYQLWRHRLGTPAGSDVCVYTEDDERFFLGVDRTKDDRLVLVHCGSKVTDEWRWVDAADPTAQLRVVHPREQGLEYAVDHRDGRFLIVTNADGATNFKLCEAPVDGSGRDQWREVLAVRDDVKLDGVDVFASFVVLAERADGVRRLRVRHDDGTIDPIAPPEPVSTTALGANPEYRTTSVRFGYTSLVTPSSVFDYDVTTGERTLLKQQPVLGDWDPARYESGREWATAGDGTRIPVSWVRRTDAPAARGEAGPCLLYGYGSYEHSIDPGFSSLRLTLLDRGFTFAIAHVRGGGEMGRSWYERGKFLAKPNTFTDFVAAAEHLVGLGWTDPEHLAARGGSAGGLLMGAVCNLRPDLFRAVVAEVPFVDALTTMLDESLPLTVTEWEEWGNPNEPEFYACMKSYAPYDNVTAQPYPALLVTGGLNDPRVSYWEPAKWVQRLRERTTSDHPILLKTELGAGHQGPSGRYDAWRDEALVYAFLLTQLGVVAA